MTDLLTFIEATKGTSLKIEVTSKDLLEFADALVEGAAAKDVIVILTSLKSLNDETEESQPVLYGVSVILD